MAGMQWYIVHVYSGFEKKVAQSIREQARLQGLEDLIEDVIVPSEEVVEMRRGAKVKSERKFFPGYVLARIDMTDQTWHLVKNTPKVTGFLGSGGKPVPISDDEADRVLKQVKEGVERPKPSITFEIGETVRVCDGPFTSFNGLVEEVDEERARVKVAVSIFGRATPVELLDQAPSARGTGEPIAADRAGARSGGAQHHGVLQDVQCADPESRAGHADPDGDFGLSRSDVLVRDEDPAGELFLEEGGRPRKRLG
jgi:transcriptional antiterminator NusG